MISKFFEHAPPWADPAASGALLLLLLIAGYAVVNRMGDTVIANEFDEVNRFVLWLINRSRHQDCVGDEGDSSVRLVFGIIAVGPSLPEDCHVWAEIYRKDGSVRIFIMHAVETEELHLRSALEIASRLRQKKYEAISSEGAISSSHVFIVHKYGMMQFNEDRDEAT